MLLFAPPTRLCPDRLLRAPHGRLPCCPRRASPRHLSMRAADPLMEKLVAACTGRGVDRIIAQKVLSSAKSAMRDWSCVVSDFLTPPESAALVATLAQLPRLSAHAWGGYPDAERTAVVCAHEDVAEDTAQLLRLAAPQFSLLSIAGDFEGGKVAHRDVMGAVLHAGVSRAKIGDILVEEGVGAQVVAHADVAAFLEAQLVSVRDVSVLVERRPLEEIRVPERRVKLIQTVEASMRIDAVVSAGFKISRSKLATMAKSGLVFLNYTGVKGPAKNVKEGDVVSVRGVGKLKIAECSMTSKGRYRISMERYI